jgi:SOS-response transcriptional repressor LexA
MDDSGLTERDARILTAIDRHCTEAGEPPTIRELQVRVRVASRDSLYATLARLVSAGLLEHSPGRWRCYRRPKPERIGTFGRRA